MTPSKCALQLWQVSFEKENQDEERECKHGMHLNKSKLTECGAEDLMAAREECHTPTDS